MRETVVKLTQVSKEFRRVKALFGIDMNVYKGDIYGFIGQNGAGKSTTLKIITGFIRSTSGEIRLFNEDRGNYTAKRIGSLIENPGLFPNLSAFDNMDIRATAIGISDKKEIGDLLDLVGLDKDDKKKVKHYSLGMKQRLGIAMALIGTPDLLILDEPINGLDPEGIKEIREVMRYLNESRQITIIVSSHILGELSKIATRYGIIRSGVMIEEIDAAELQHKCRNYLSLTIDDIESGVVVLEQELLIKDYLVANRNELQIYDQTEGQAVSAVLAKHHINIEQMYYKKQDLETYFLEKIGGGEHA